MARRRRGTAKQAGRAKRVGLILLGIAVGWLLAWALIEAAMHGNGLVQWKW